MDNDINTLKTEASGHQMAMYCVIIHKEVGFRDTHREKHRQIKLQHLQKVRIWAFVLLVQQISSL